MPLKDIQEPDKPPRKPKNDRAKKEDKPHTDHDEVSPDNPWRTNEETGRRERNTRALPYEIRLRELFVELSGAVALGDTFMAKAIELKGEELAYGYARLAKEDPRIKAFMAKLLEGSAWTAALIPTVSLLIIGGWHYGFIPSRIGVPMTLANGMMPFTRQQEQEIQAAQQAEQDRAATRSRATHPNGDKGDGGDSAS